MPIFPPWIRAAEPAQYYGQGYGLGLREWEQQAADARAWNEMAQQAQNAAARQALAEQEEARREAEFGLAQEELGMRQASEQRKAQEASQLYAARQEYQRRVDAGEDPATVLAGMAPLMGAGWQTAMSALMRRKGTAEIPQQVMGIPLIDPATGQAIPGIMGAPTTTGGVNFHPQPGYAAAETAKRREKLTPSAQAALLTRMPELAGIAPAMTNAIPTLQSNIFNTLGIPQPTQAPAPPVAPSGVSWWQRLFGLGARPQAAAAPAPAQAQATAPAGSPPTAPDDLRAQALDAIDRGADEDAVRDRYKELTGEDLE